MVFNYLFKYGAASAMDPGSLSMLGSLYQKNKAKYKDIISKYSGHEGEIHKQVMDHNHYSHTPFWSEFHIPPPNPQGTRPGREYRSSNPFTSGNPFGSRRTTRPDPFGSTHPGGFAQEFADFMNEEARRHREFYRRGEYARSPSSMEHDFHPKIPTILKVKLGLGAATLAGVGGYGLYKMMSKKKDKVTESPKVTEVKLPKTPKKKSMKKQAFNPINYADDAVIALKNILLNQPAQPAQPDPNKKPQSIFITNKTAEEINNSFEQLLGKPSVKTKLTGEEEEEEFYNREKPKKIDRLPKQPVDENIRKNREARRKMKAMHKPVEEEPKTHYTKPPTKSTSSPQSTPPPTAPPTPPINMHGHGPPPSFQFREQVVNNLKTKGFVNHILKHKLPYGLGVLGAGAVGSKILFDRLNKKEEVKEAPKDSSKGV